MDGDKRMVDMKTARNWVGAIVLLIILAAIGVLILSELYGSMKPGSTTVNNETISTPTSGTPAALTHTGSNDFPADIGGTILTNESNGAPFTQNDTNWYVNSTLGNVVILDTIISSDGDGVEDLDNTDFNLTYSYAPGATKTDVLKNGTLSISNVTKQMPTVGIIMGVLLIIGAVVLIARYFGRQYTA